jgi:hypothetical protein
MGKLPHRLFYNVSVTNNLSILGVSASQLGFGLNTYSGKNTRARRPLLSLGRKAA